MKRIETNPNAATVCECCGRPLRDPRSVELGIGPVCRAGGSGARQEDLFRSRSDYTVEDLGHVVLIVDLDKGGRSVTNDADGVIRDLQRFGLLHEGKRVIYRDSTGMWDELVHEGGRFVRFDAIQRPTREQALAWVGLTECARNFARAQAARRLRDA